MTITKIGKLQQLELGELIETLDPDHDGKVSIDRYVALGKKLRAAQAMQTWSWGGQFTSNARAFCILCLVLTLGMFIFPVFERSNWDDYIQVNEMLIKTPLENSLPIRPYIDDILNDLDNATLKAEIEAAIFLYKDTGMFSTAENLMNPYDFKNPWVDYEDSLYFVLSVATTIGYGNFAPKTDEGKIFLIIYSIPAIIAVGWFIKENVTSLQHLDWTIGVKWQVLIGLFLLAIYLALSAWYFQFVMRNQEEDSNGNDISLDAPGTEALAAAALELITGQPVDQSDVDLWMSQSGEFDEGWSFLDGIYFTWVSISTIGLGDLLPDISSWDRNLGILVVLVVGIHVASVVIAIGGGVIFWLESPFLRAERFEQSLMNRLEMSKFEAIKKDIDII